MNETRFPRDASDPIQLPLTFAPERRVFSATDLNAAVQRTFEGSFANISVAGEVSGCRIAGSGHHYFSLKDERSQVKCVLFRGAGRFLRFKPQDGLAVLARGSLEVYQARGEYQLIVESLEAQGTGALQVAFERLKERLAAEGAFDPAKKKPLPVYPSRVGVVTSPSGAVVFDILNVLARRFPGLHIRIYPAQVQGEGAADQICAGVNYFDRSGWAEVVIVARGGGSLEDLWTFNEESVARAVLAASVPIVSAVGHETDFSICDFVADVRAATPSAAAELIICTRSSLLDQIAAARARLLQIMRYLIAARSRTLNLKGFERAETLVHRFLTQRAQAFDELYDNLRISLRQKLDSNTQRLSSLTARLQASDLRLRLSRASTEQLRLDDRLRAAMLKRLWLNRQRWESNHLHLQQISPLAVLKRGYAIVEDPDGKVVRSAEAVQPGSALRVRLGEGALNVAVQTVSSRP